MNPASLSLAGLNVSRRLIVFFAALIILTALNLQADAPPTIVRIQNTGADAEGLQTFRLEWDSVSNATYRVQQSGSLAPGTPWKTVDVITPVGGTMQYDIKGRSIPENSIEFYRLLLPQPEIFSVEPAVIAPGVAVNLSIVGQCFRTNDVLRINGVPQTNVVFQSATLLSSPSFTSDVAGTYVFELVISGQVVSSFNVTCADALTNPELVLQGPPLEPPASPSSLWFSKKGYDYYQAQSQLNSAGRHNNPAFLENKNVGEMPNRRLAAFPSRKGYDYYGSSSVAGKKLYVGNLPFSQTDESISERWQRQGIGHTLVIKESSSVSSDGKKGLNAVNVKLARTAAIAGGIAGGAVAGIVIAAREAGGDDCDDNDPGVIPFSGEVSQQVVDLAVEGRGLDFIWTRTYHSRIGRTGASVNGWTFSHDVRCVLNSAGGMDVFDGTGRKDAFQPGTNGVYTCPEFFREGTLSNNVFRLAFADTGYWEFNPLDGSPAAGKIARYCDRNENSARCEYDATGRLIRVVDTLNRTNTVSYNPVGQLASVTDFSGRTVSYTYYQGGELGGSPGDLKSVTSPPVTGTPNGNDFPDGKTTSYTYSSGYSDDRKNHLMLSVIDAQGQTTSQFVYQYQETDFEFLRCISHQRGTLTSCKYRWVVTGEDYAVIRCIINDPMGNVTECSYDARNRLVKMREFTGRAIPGVAVTDTLNRPINKLRASDPDYFECRAEWNNDSLCRKLVMFGGQQMECVYQSDFDKTTTARKRADLCVLREVACCDQDDDGDGHDDTLVTRYEYDPRFGTGERYGRVKVHFYWDRAGRNEDNQNVRKGWDGTIKGRFAAGPRQTTSQDGSFAHRAVQDFEKNTENVSGGFGIMDTGDEDGGFVTSATDARGHVTTGVYDDRGNLTEIAAGVGFNGGNGIEVRATNSRRYNAYGQVTSITNVADASGYQRVDTFSYFSSGPQAGYLQSIAIDEPGVQLTTSFERDARGNVTRIVDPRTNDWLFIYNSLDQCVRVQTPINLTSRCATDFSYDANDNLVQCATEVRSETDALLGTRVAISGYDSLHRLIRGTHAVDGLSSLTNEFVYDGNDQCVLVRGGDAVSGVDPFHTVVNEYDERGLLFREIGAPGSGISRTNEFDYNANGKIKKIKCELYVERMSFDGFDRLSTIEDPMGNRTTFAFDANDNLKLVRQFGQTNDVAGTNGNVRLAETSYTYNSLDWCAFIHDAIFDVSTQLPIGDGECTTTCAYAPNGQCTSVTDDLGRVTSYTYDTVGRPASSSSPGGKTVQVRLVDRAGNVTGIIQTDRSDLGGAPQVFSRTNVFDSLDRCISTTDNVGNTDSCAFDSLDRVVKMTDPRGLHSFYTYDLLNRQTLAVADLDGDGLPSLALDITEMATWSSSNGRLLATTDSHGNTTSYAYDSLSRRTNVTHADGTQLKLVWSPRSNLIQETDANGTVAFHTYDLNDRCISNSYTAGSTVAASTTFEQFAYDGSSRLVSASNDGSVSTFTYDSLGRNTRDVSGGLGALTTFDSVGNRLSLTYPGGRALTYAYDSQNRCTNILETGASLASFSYDGPSRASRVILGNGTRTQIIFDGLSGVPNAQGDFGHGEISSVTHGITGSSTRIAGVTLKWDRNGNKTARTDVIFPPALPRTNVMTLAFDPVDRLTRATVLSGSALVRDTIYGLDRMGNRTNVLGALCSGNYHLDALVPGPLDFQMNQYTTTPCDANPRTYDENGNLLSRSSGSGGALNYTYDCHDRLVWVTDSGAPVTAYAYDALGRRIARTIFPGGLPPLTTQFFYDGDSIIEERVNGAVTATYVIDGSTSHDPDGVVQMQRGGQPFYYHTDDQGNVLALTTTGGQVVERYDYDDYGAVTFLTSDGIATSETSSGVGNPFLFQGMEWDAETGFYQMRSDTPAPVYHGRTGKTGRAKPYADPNSGRSITRCDEGSCNFADNNPWSDGRVIRKMIPITVPDISGAQRRVSVNGSGAGSASGLSRAFARSAIGNGSAGVFLSKGTHGSTVGGSSSSEGNSITQPQLYSAKQGKTGRTK